MQHKIAFKKCLNMKALTICQIKFENKITKNNYEKYFDKSYVTDF